MSKQLELFIKNRSLIDFQVSALLFRTTFGPWKYRIFILVLGILNVIGFVLNVLYIRAIYSGGLNIKFVSASMVLMAYTQLIFKGLFAALKTKSFLEIFQWIKFMYEEQLTDPILQLCQEKYLTKAIRIWKTIFQ